MWENSCQHYDLTTKPPPHPLKTGSSREKRLIKRGHIKQEWWFILITLPNTNIAPENRPSQKEIGIPTINFHVQTVSFREGNHDASVDLPFFSRQGILVQVDTWKGHNSIGRNPKQPKTGWWFQPIWKICSSNWKSSLIFGVKIFFHFSLFTAQSQLKRVQRE